MNAALTVSSADAQRQRAAVVTGPVPVSIVVPVLNEARLIRNFLQHLRVRAPEAEIIVVDGGSLDGTAELAAGFCDQLVRAKPGRAMQMNAGARAARGDILWFLHVDVEVPARCLDEIVSAVVDPKIASGYFRIRLPRERVVYRFTDEFAHYAGILLRMRCGDHGIFCRREDFLALGGFPQVSLMEDVEFFRRLHRCGRVVCIDKRLVVSARRYETIGRARLTLAYGLIATLYVLHTPLDILARLYAWTCSHPKTRNAASGANEEQPARRPAPCFGNK